MKVVLSILLLSGGFWTMVIESGYFFPVLLLIVLAVTITMLWLNKSSYKVKAKNYKLHRFVLMSGYAKDKSGRDRYITTRKLASLYEIDPGEYIVYPPTGKGYMKTEHDVILPPLNEGEDYLKYKEETLDKFYEQQAVS